MLLLMILSFNMAKDKKTLDLRHNIHVCDRKHVATVTCLPPDSFHRYQTYLGNLSPHLATSRRCHRMCQIHHTNFGFALNIGNVMAHPTVLGVKSSYLPKCQVLLRRNPTQ